jgi:hypothetical protein
MGLKRKAAKTIRKVAAFKLVYVSTPIFIFELVIATQLHSQPPLLAARLQFYSKF